MKVTFVDADVLIAIVRGDPEIAARAVMILEDPNRVFASSEFVRLEILPKAHYHQRKAELQFYNSFFSRVSLWAKPLEEIVERAHEEAVRAGLSALDALHIAAAAITGADELITGERIGKPMYRTKSVLVRSVRHV